MPAADAAGPAGPAGTVGPAGPAGLGVGTVDPRLDRLVEKVGGWLAADPTLRFQAAAFADGRLVLHLWGGMDADDLVVPFSVSKTTIGLVAGLLVQRGLLDLDAPVAEYWPEFAVKGKARITVRQLLSHQAGLPQADPPLTWDETMSDHAGAARLADTRPLWHPGSAFGYHARTIGTLAGELVSRITGRTIQRFYDDEIRSVIGADFFLGLPPELDDRRVPLEPMIPPPGHVPGPLPSPLAGYVFDTPGAPADQGNDERSWRFGHPATSATGSARGIAGVLAGAVTGLDGADAVLDADTVGTIGQQQVRGRDEVLGQDDRAHAIVFQKPGRSLPFGGWRAFGHDGAAGCLGVVDPEAGVTFAWTVVRGPWPGGADPRALMLARDIPALLA